MKFHLMVSLIASNILRLSFWTYYYGKTMQFGWEVMAWYSFPLPLIACSGLHVVLMWAKALNMTMSWRGVWYPLIFCGVLMTTLFGFAVAFWKDTCDRRTSSTVHSIGILAPLVVIMLFVVVVDIAVLRFGFRIVKRLGSAPTNTGNRDAMGHMIQRILSITRVLFSITTCYFVVGVIGFFHIMLFNGVMLYKSGDNSYKVFAYAVVWEVLNVGLIAMLAWVVKTPAPPSHTTDTNEDDHKTDLLAKRNSETKGIFTAASEDSNYSHSSGTTTRGQKAEIPVSIVLTRDLTNGSLELLAADQQHLLGGSTHDGTEH
jgi:hypothetical protein